MEPYWRPERSFQQRMEHPNISMYNQAPGSMGNNYRVENYEFCKQKTYLEWNPPNYNKPIDYKQYDRVDKYDITKES